MSINRDDSKVFNSLYQNFTLALNAVKRHDEGSEYLTLSDACLKTVRALATQHVISPSSEALLSRVERELAPLGSRELSTLSDADVGHITEVFKSILGVVPSSQEGDSGIGASASADVAPAEVFQVMLSKEEGASIIQQFTGASPQAYQKKLNQLAGDAKKFLPTKACLRELGDYGVRTVKHSGDSFKFPELPPNLDLLKGAQPAIETLRDVEIEGSLRSVPDLFAADHITTQRGANLKLGFPQTDPSSLHISTEKEALTFIQKAEAFVDRISQKDTSANEKQKLLNTLLCFSTQQLGNSFASPLLSIIKINLCLSRNHFGLGATTSNPECSYSPVKGLFGKIQPNAFQLNYRTDVIIDPMDPPDDFDEKQFHAALDACEITSPLSGEVRASCIIEVPKTGPYIVKDLKFTSSITIV